MQEAIITLLSLVGAAFAIWLIVRVVNQHARWAKWVAEYVAFVRSIVPAWIFWLCFLAVGLGTMYYVLDHMQGWMMRD